MSQILYIDSNNNDYTYTPTWAEEIDCAVAYFTRRYGDGADYESLLDDYGLMDVLDESNEFNDFEAEYFEEKAKEKYEIERKYGK